MKERRTINLPISFEYLLSFLFGKHSYHGFVGLKVWEDGKNGILGHPLDYRFN